MKWLELNKKKAAAMYEQLEQNYKGKTIKQIEQTTYDQSYHQIKQDIYHIFYETMNELNITEEMVKKAAYEFDYLFGIKLYRLLTEKYGMNTYLASNDAIWRYLQLNVCPYLVYLRWSFNPDSFYQSSRRIWLKSIWWYVFLAWKENEELTREILKENSTDTIVQLVERTGKYGYRVELYKQILYKKYQIHLKDRETFRKIMILNTMRVKVTDPYLVEGGINQYVEDLFQDVIIK